MGFLTKFSLPGQEKYKLVKFIISLVVFLFRSKWRTIPVFPLLFSILVILFTIQRPVLSFTVDLIHRDSPQSPLYDQFATKWDRLHGAFRRTASRADMLINLSSKSPKDIDSRLFPGDGEFVMKLFIGTPPVPQYALVDSGSDLSWFQVNGCTNCFDQKGPRFNPEHSLTFRNVSCGTPSCKIVASSTCLANSTATCKYSLNYAGFLTHVSGYVGSETLTFGSTSNFSASIPRVIFGCGMDNDIKYDKYLDGLIGLGIGKESFINQASKYMPRKFSYCLPPIDSGPNVTGKISFGNSAHVTTPDAVIIPLQRNKLVYKISMENIFINNQRLYFLEGKQIEKTNFDMFLDSGTMLTYLPNILYDKVALEVQKYIPAKAFTDAPYEICYKRKDIIKFPTITLTFKGGEELELTDKSTFYHINPDTVCLVILSSGSDNNGIIGNIAQSNFLVGFDLGKNVVSFKRSDCTK